MKMNMPVDVRRTLGYLPATAVIILALVGISAAIYPWQAWAMVRFVAESLLSIVPFVFPGVFLAAWIMSSGADAHIARAFQGRLVSTSVVASVIGAITPVCGVTALPLLAGLLTAGIPLAPVMAFWLASPITGPSMFATTAATLGLEFAVAKTLAAVGLGLWGGGITAAFTGKSWVSTSLRTNRLIDGLASRECAEPLSFNARVWTAPARRVRFRQNFLGTVRLLLICLIPAFAAEYVLNAALQPSALSGFVGDDVWWAIPFAVFVGAPAYIDGYAALPVTRGLIEHGMSPGAAMAFLVSGGVVSIWGAMAIAPVLKLKPFLLYLGLAVTGSLIAGYIFDLVS
jgi:uncharacterized membrane protein YraQ (UPF0718 family)